MYKSCTNNFDYQNHLNNLISALSSDAIPGYYLPKRLKRKLCGDLILNYAFICEKKSRLVNVCVSGCHFFTHFKPYHITTAPKRCEKNSIQI